MTHRPGRIWGVDMTRLSIILAAGALIVVGAFYLGNRWDDAKDADVKTKTLERVNDADVSKGDAKDDLDWVRDFVDGL